MVCMCVCGRILVSFERLRTRVVHPKITYRKLHIKYAKNAYPMKKF